MNKLLRLKITLYAIIFFVVLILGLIIWCAISLSSEVNYVASNYVSTSSRKSPKVSRSAFVYDYTVKSGDDTLATLTGINTTKPSQFGSIINQYSSTDLRGLVQLVARAWIEQGEHEEYLKDLAENSLAGFLAEAAPTTQGALDTIVANHFGSETDEKYQFKLYRGGAYSQEFSYTLLSGQKKTLASAMCCCCLCEVVSTFAGEYTKSYSGHVRAIGLHNTVRKTDGYNIDKNSMSDFCGSKQIVLTDYSRRVQYPLSDNVTNANTTMESLIDSGVIQVGSVLLWTRFKDGSSDRHVDMVVYIDKAAKQVYLAGAGNDWRILADAAYGYDKIREYGNGEVWTAWDEPGKDEEGIYLVNSVHYSETVRYNK